MFWFCISILTAAWPPAAAGQTLSLDQVLGKVQETYEKHGDFQADFVQETFIRSLGRKQRAEGVVFFKKPGKMHWKYEKPAKQQIVSDGQTLWNYQPENRQVIVGRMTQAFQSRTPSSFLAGLGNLRKDFQSRFSKDPSPGAPYELELTPMDAQGGMERLFLMVDPERFHILEAKIEDAMGNTTRIIFSRIAFDQKPADSLFTFTPPAGVEVFTLPGAAPPAGAGK